MKNSTYKAIDSSNKPVLYEVSFIATVLNEEESICGFLESLVSQTCLPGEIIIVDGGSKDNTFRLMEEFFRQLITEGKLKALLRIRDLSGTGTEGSKENMGSQKVHTGVADPDTGADKQLEVVLAIKPGTCISEGRNTAINMARGKIICVSDAGCLLDEKWMEEINSVPDSGDRIIAGGMNHPLCRTFLEKNLALCIMPGSDGIREKNYMPSSRNTAFPRTAWEEAGGYPGYMDFGEDMKFNFILRSIGFRVRFNPEAKVYWKMRESRIQIFKQFFRYAKGDARGGMYTHRHAARFLFFTLIPVLIILSVLINIWILAAFIPLVPVYVYRPYRRLFIKWDGNEGCRTKGGWKLLSILFIPLLLFYIDLAKACGYLYGIFKPRKSKIV